MLTLYIPCKDKQQATDIAAHLLKKKLIACANIIPSTSMYIWKGKLETNDEHILLAKTTDKRYKNIEKEVLRLHTYDCPCITAWKLSHVNSAYKKWVSSMVK
ncbi:MAG: divalent-cation tolerance protein CutA [Nanoarchaeota archaeon]